MRQVSTNWEILAENFSFAGRSVVDVGCGTGELVRWLTGQGANVTGLDTPQMLEKGESSPRAGGEKYMTGGAEKLPLEDECADLIIYFASLHHAPPERLADALSECRRVLKPGGHAVFIEPVAQPGSYYEIVRLVEDEAEIQKLAHAAIRDGTRLGMRAVKEELFFIERSFEDYVRLLNTFVDDENKRETALRQARIATERLAAESGQRFGDYRFRSTCRLHILEKGDR
ncbi:MAG: class I SAM-dependent methyltransferase [Acidobacteriota bacterium]